mmetsp:Transcript_84179/g.168028  ORF Transcript_84179/g.168028 Transcript_84179/m.168028 type:complete len:85 (+) Transcript_84179:1415-1669(+)
MADEGRWRPWALIMATMGIDHELACPHDVDGGTIAPRAVLHLPTTAEHRSAIPQPRFPSSPMRMVCIYIYSWADGTTIRVPPHS